MFDTCLKKTISYNFRFNNNNQYIECIIRKKFVKITPEEKVRQSFLSLIVSIVDTDKYTIRVEYRSLDISIYKKNIDSDFNPFSYPIMIIELKRNSSNLIQHKKQLFDYLNINQCRTGILSTCKEVYKYDRHNNKLKQITIDVFNQILQMNKDNIDYSEMFECAKNGCIDSFLELIREYGTNNRVVFLSSSYPFPVEAIWLTTVNDQIMFDIAGVRGKRKQKRISFDSFIRLISIKE